MQAHSILRLIQVMIAAGIAHLESHPSIEGKDPEQARTNALVSAVEHAPTDTTPVPAMYEAEEKKTRKPRKEVAVQQTISEVNPVPVPVPVPVKEAESVDHGALLRGAIVAAAAVNKAGVIAILKKYSAARFSEIAGADHKAALADVRALLDNGNDLV